MEEYQQAMTKMPVTMSKTEEELFRACTTITVGNGEGTRFWHDCWLHGQSPKEIALALYRLAWLKNLTVAYACTAGRWMNGFQRVATSSEINQFAMLWTLIRQINLTQQEDVEIHV
jgi:hypothetical protein